jgi:hypothetical protein
VRGPADGGNLAARAAAALAGAGVCRTVVQVAGPAPGAAVVAGAAGQA